MDQEQARRLGDYFRQRRESLGLSQRRLAAISGLNQPTVVRIEDGQFLAPGPDKLKALASALDLNPTDVWSLAGYAFDTDLPSPLPFLRAKYRDLTDDQLDALTSDVASILERHGIDPYDRPAPGEDETGPSEKTKSTTKKGGTKP